MTDTFKTILLSILIVMCAACEEEYLIVTETEEEGQETIELVSTTIVGNVLDLSTMPLTNVIVDLSVDNTILSSTKADAEGGFSFQNVSAKEENTLLVFRSTDHAISYKVISIKEDLTQYTEVQLNENASDEFSVSENINYADELISYNIDPDQINNLASSNIRLNTSVVDSDLIKSHFLYPVGGIDEDDNIIHLDHHMVFQIQLFDSNDKQLNIIEGGEFDLQLKTQIDFAKYDLWHFDERTAFWKLDEAATLVNTPTLMLRKTGLYSIARRNQPYTLSGIVKDQNGEITPNVKITIRNENGKIINETFSNSLGEYVVQLIKDLAGNIKISQDGTIVEEISFDEISDPLITEIVLMPTILTCKQLTISVAQNTCEAELRPMDIYEQDISELVSFGLEINQNMYAAWNPDQAYQDIDWPNLLNKTTDYTITYLTQVGESPSCSNTITVIDSTPPLVICIDKLSVNVEQMTTIIFAADLDEGSFDNFCSTSSPLTFTIARTDHCTQECEEDDFAQNVEFDLQDVGKTIPVILKGTDSSGMSNSCWTDVVIIE